MNSTPDFQPVAAEIVEYHEVTEGRVIHGHDMTFHAPMFGTAHSDGGCISLESSCGWGSVVNPGGHIKGSKRVFNATLQAPGGNIEITSAESCLIIGREVTLTEAVKCQIFAHTLRIGKASGCMIAGRDIEIRQVMSHRQEPNVITMVVPEVPDLNEMLVPINAEMADMKSRLDELTQRIDHFRADSTLAKYLSIRAKVRSGMLKLTDDQSKGYLEMAERLEESAKAVEIAVAERTPIARALAVATRHVQDIREAQHERLAQCRCNVAHVQGETIIRQLLEAHDGADLSLIPLPMIPKILFRNDASLKFLYAVHDGSVAWTADQI